MDEDVLDAYVRSLAKSAEYQGKFINYVELRALIQRFKRLNPDADPKTVDWVGVWDERLEYSELLEAFRRNYPMYRWVEDGVTMEGFEDARKRRLERIVRELDEDSLRELSRLIREELGEARRWIATQRPRRLGFWRLSRGGRRGGEGCPPPRGPDRGPSDIRLG
jgi:hypothetical protein